MRNYTTIIITRGGNTVKCVYPKSSFETMFVETDKSNKWLNGGIEYTLSVFDQKALGQDIDSAINNIENLDLA